MCISFDPLGLSVCPRFCSVWLQIRPKRRSPERARHVHPFKKEFKRSYAFTSLRGNPPFFNSNGEAPSHFHIPTPTPGDQFQGPVWVFVRWDRLFDATLMLQSSVEQVSGAPQPHILLDSQPPPSPTPISRPLSTTCIFSKVRLPLAQKLTHLTPQWPSHRAMGPTSTPVAVVSNCTPKGPPQRAGIKAKVQEVQPEVKEVQGTGYRKEGGRKKMLKKKIARFFKRNRAPIA
ncbi:hypothetical protein NLI96_g11349 [Meripilus lineatus]|uniref:Uncharacterized protein n=1 Tax=Meripilus lineatus TaxID=2056292 RepID=A0AAD5YB04_9APHY|nr:hypothetical protein NLI96_g11349 [Physisporinus lineatus]